jgi:hypothetical protein
LAPLFFLNHLYSFCPALTGANATALAIIQIGFEVAVFILPDAALGAEEITNPTFDAFLMVQYRAL